MDPRQRENIARYLYDVSKILFATTVVSNLVMRTHFDVITFMWGAASSFISLGWGYLLDR